MPVATVADLIVAEVSSSSKVFFQVVSLRPSRAHLAASAEFTADDIGVMLLKCEPEGTDSYRVQTTGFRLLSPVVGTCGLQAQPLVLSLSSLNLGQLCSCAVWERPTSLDAGAGSESTSFVATNSKPVLPVRGDVPREEAFVFELLERLHESGWAGAVARGLEQRTDQQCFHKP